jgi:hypothetical protein
MERFRLRVKEQARRGQIWELHMFPNMPNRVPREADAATIGSSSSPETIQWLRDLSDPYLQNADEPIAAADFRPGVPARWLQHADGMRLALAFASARYLTKAAQRTQFRNGLLDLPGEVVLYWFTLCFYGYRQQAGRAALRTLFTYEQSETAPPHGTESEEPKAAPKRKSRAKPKGPSLFDSGEAGGGGKSKTPAKRKTHAQAG